MVSEIGNENTFTGSVKLALVERVYGYPGVRSLGRSDLGARLGDLFAPVLSLARKAGYAVRFLPARPGGKLLDVGCGNGSFLHLMRRLAWEVQGIEPDPEAAAIAAAQNLCVEVADVTRAELPDSYFDAITLTHVAEHFPAPAAAFATLARALKPGGIIVSISPNPAGVVRRLFGNKWYQLDPPRHFVIPSERAYRAILEPLGFNVQIWTSMRMSYWAIRESMSIARAGAAHRSGGGFLSRLLHIGVVMVSFLLPGSGEEVICYATKK
ncbi:MAG: class I SAM-dependent methyltransferase [Chthoniobacterales bacterium]